MQACCASSHLNPSQETGNENRGPGVNYQTDTAATRKMTWTISEDAYLEIE